MDRPARTVLGCLVSDATFKSWASRLVFEDEPIYLTDGARAALLDDTSVVGRAALPRFSLDFADAYLTYSVSAEARWVALLNPDAVRRLSGDLRADLMRLQSWLGRGQLYSRAFVDSALGEDRETLDCLEPDTFDTPDGPKVALRRDVWSAFSDEGRERWLTAFVSEGRLDCLSAGLSEDGWMALAEAHGPAIGVLAGTFAAASGPNCFSTVLAALTADEKWSAKIAQTWLLREEFERGLLERGFVETGPLKDAPAPPGSVLTWLDENGNTQHACLALIDGLALNKDAQGWYAPRQLLPLASLLASWADEGLEVRVHVRGGART